MPKLSADFSAISTARELLQDDVYVFVVREVKEDLTSTGKQRITIIAEVEDPDHPNETSRKAKMFDGLVMTKNDGSLNEISLRQLKRYMEAILGEDAANTDELDTDDLVGGKFLGEVKLTSYEKNGEQIPKNEFRKILPYNG